MAWLDENRTALLESGCALIVGTIDPDGAPCAGRGWGLDVSDEPGQVRLLLDGDDDATLRNATEGAPVAVTAASVRTLRSVQLKGRIAATEPAGPDDVARAGRYCTAMFTDINETDLTPLEVIEALRPQQFTACTVVVEELFDQTPGPAAGARVAQP